MDQKIQPIVQQHVPFFSNEVVATEGNPSSTMQTVVSKNPSSNDVMDSIYHDDPLKNQMIRQKVKTNSKIPIQITSFQEKEKNPYIKPHDPNHAYVKELSDELQKAVQ